MPSDQVEREMLQRLASIEAGVGAVNDKIDALSAKSDSQDQRLTAAEVRLATLGTQMDAMQDRQGGWRATTPLAAALVGAVSGTIALLDRLYK